MMWAMVAGASGLVLLGVLAVVSIRGRRRYIRRTHISALLLEEWKWEREGVPQEWTPGRHRR